MSRGQGQVNKEERSRRKLEILAKCSRLGCLWALFEASLFEACTLKLTRPLDSKSNQSRVAPFVDREQLSARLFSGELDELACSSQLRRAVAIYSQMFIVLYAYFSAVSIVTCLLDMDALASYRYLDCYLVGRFTLNGRASATIKYICLQLTLTVLIFRLFTTFGGKLNLYAQAVDFSFKDLGSIEEFIQRHDLTRHEMAEPISEANKATFQLVAADKGQALDSSRTRSGQGSCHFYYKRCEQLVLSAGSQSVPDRKSQTNNALVLDRRTIRNARLQSRNEREHEQEIYNDRVMFVKIECPSGNLVVMKLNRFAQNWHDLHLVVFATLLAWTVIIVVWIMITIAIMTPTIVSKKGFEQSYPNCVKYIGNYVNTSQSRASDFESIYKIPTANGSLSTGSGSNGGEYDAPLPPGHYHLLRMSFDYFNSVVFFADAIAYIAAFVCMQMQIFYDLISNASEIHKRLVRLRTNCWEQLALSRVCYNDNWRKQHQPTRSDFSVQLLAHPLRPTLTLDSRERNQAHLSGFRQLNSRNTTIECLLLQALLLDHFQTLKKYNSLLSICCIIGITAWSGFTCVNLTWLGISPRDAIDFEFYVAEACVSILLVLYLLWLSLIGASNRKFYPLISSLMALDDARSITKPRWMRILNYYHPRPMFSFMIISAEVSFLLVLKMIAWTFSALFVVISFFYLRKETMERARAHLKH